MYALKYGKGGEHIPEEVQPAWYTEEKNGKWQACPSHIKFSRDQLGNSPLAGTATLPASESAISPFALLVPTPGTPLGWFLLWDRENGWTGSVYLPMLVPSLSSYPLPESSPFRFFHSIREYEILSEFRKKGQDASFHYADDSGREWNLGDQEKDKAIALWQAYPHLEQDMLEIGKNFLWSFRNLVDAKKKGIVL